MNNLAGFTSFISATVSMVTDSQGLLAIIATLKDPISLIVLTKIERRTKSADLPAHCNTAQNPPC